MSGDPERATAPEPAHARAPDTLQLELDDLLAALVEAVVREGPTNVARHTHASQVIDDGVGIGEAARRSGLANLRDRAERHGGQLAAPDHEGTHLRWTIPLN